MTLNFNEFQADNKEAWKERILKELKGKPYESLVWNHPEGFNIEPDQSASTDNAGVPGKFPYMRGVKTESNNWEIVQFMASDEEAKMNERALEALEGGVEGLIISLDAPKNLSRVLKGVFLNFIGLHFTGDFTKENQTQLEALITEAGISGKEIYGTCELYLFDNELELRNEKIEQAIRLKQLFPRLKTVKVRGDKFHNKGAMAALELAVTLSLAHDSFIELLKAGMSPDDASATLSFTLGIGSSYFTEMAKFKVLRQLWGLIVDKYKPEHSCSRACYIQAVSSNWNKTVLDEENNLLRTTTEAMSAVLGGADSVCLFPFNDLSKSFSNSGSRYARNIQHLLKSESFLNQTIDPSGGSYYIEKLQKEIRDKAWRLFCEFESEGGFIALQRSGKLEQLIQKDANAQKEALETENRVMIGVNKYKPVDSKTAICESDRLAKLFEV